MNKHYNRNTTSDMPMDTYLNGPIESFQENKTKKQKINAIGKKANRAKENEVSQKLNTRPEDEDWGEQFKDVRKNHEENLKIYHTKTKRNRVAITILSILLIVAISSIGIYVYIASLEINCNMIVHGANATYIVDGEELSRFRAPSNLQGNRVLELNIQLKIEESGFFEVRFVPKCYQNGKLMDNTLIYNYNMNLFYDGGDGYCYSKNPIKGNQTISLCGGVILDYYYENTLNVNNFRLEFHTYIEEI